MARWRDVDVLLISEGAGRHAGASLAAICEPMHGLQPAAHRVAETLSASRENRSPRSF